MNRGYRPQIYQLHAHQSPLIQQTSVATLDNQLSLQYEANYKRYENRITIAFQGVLVDLFTFSSSNILTFSIEIKNSADKSSLFTIFNS